MKENKFIDSSGRLFGKISVIDVLVLLAVVVAVSAIYVKNNLLETTSTANTDVTLVMDLEVMIAPDYIVDAIQIGDELYDTDHATGGAIGVIVGKEILPASAFAELNDGSLAMITSDKDVNVLLTVEGKGSYKDGRYSFNRVYEMGANSSRNFETKYASFVGVVHGVEVG